MDLVGGEGQRGVALDQARIGLEPARDVQRPGGRRTGDRQDLVADDREVSLEGGPDDVADGGAQVRIEGVLVGRIPVVVVHGEGREQGQSSSAGRAWT